MKIRRGFSGFDWWLDDIITIKVKGFTVFEVSWMSEFKWLYLCILGGWAVFEFKEDKIDNYWPKERE
ncbi:MAG: hypothetical protein KAX20_06995 [Candidatus Omnitrophica bacterium]|nr:hypothetical protein [Candidatus Omnitrophota bacterium]